MKLSSYLILSVLICLSCSEKDEDPPMNEPVQPLDPVYTEGNGVADYDGNFYPTIILGDQEWMAQNLRVNHYKNGVALTKVDWDDQPSWVSLESGAYLFHTPNEYEPYDLKYGKFYNFYAVKDTQCLCPEGWRVPSQDDWYNLEVFLGLDSAALASDPKRGVSAMIGEKLKSREFSSTYQPFPETNISGFNAYKGLSVRVEQSILLHFGHAQFWSSTIDSVTDYAIYREIFSFTPGFTIDYDIYGNYGISVRCMRDI